jgi:hypothetical protein
MLEKLETTSAGHSSACKSVDAMRPFSKSAKAAFQRGHVLYVLEQKSLIRVELTVLFL